MGEFEIDDMGNFVILRGGRGELLDRHDKQVNRRGYLVDRYGNIVNKGGAIIFRANELDSDDEIPAPFGFEKRKKQLLEMEADKKAMVKLNEEGEGAEIDDEDVVENELRKLRKKGGDHESSVESLMDETPARYNKQN